MAIVTNSIVITTRLTMASGVGGDKMKCNPKNWGGCAGGVSQGGKRMAKTRRATMAYKTWRLRLSGATDGRAIAREAPSIWLPQCVQ